MKTKPDPLRYAIDEGFVKIVWWNCEGKTSYKVASLSSYKESIKIIDNLTFYIPDQHYSVNAAFFKEYGFKVLGEGIASLTISNFYNEDTATNLLVDPVLKNTDAYNARREQEEKS